MLVLFNKPYGVVSQFSFHPPHKSLKDFIDIKRVYPAGRLDHDSEGLLLLTDEGLLQNQISNPKNKWEKVYFVQVDRQITKEAIDQLSSGVEIKSGLTLPTKVVQVDEPEWLWERTPPIRFRKNVPTSWIKISLKEGKNRQVRRMCAKVKFPTLRLIRYSIGPYTIENIPLGQYKKINKREYLHLK